MTDSAAEVSAERGSEEGVHQKAIGSSSESDNCDIVREYKDSQKRVEKGINCSFAGVIKCVATEHQNVTLR